jgi:hypothetical protein
MNVTSRCVATCRRLPGVGLQHEQHICMHITTTSLLDYMHACMLIPSMTRTMSLHSHIHCQATHVHAYGYLRIDIPVNGSKKSRVLHAHICTQKRACKHTFIQDLPLKRTRLFKSSYTQHVHTFIQDLLTTAA